MEIFNREKFNTLETLEHKNNYLRSANLRFADLRHADLRSANLRFADLRHADLNSADLRSADLRHADLRFADLRHADLRSANLRSANLSFVDLDFSSVPLWCGSLKMTVSKRIATQIAYHFCSLICDDAEFIEARNSILDFANQFHRVKECGTLETIEVKSDEK